jgi:predicted DCC family thiol-disulfide oxidoreductase YuxK
VEFPKDKKIILFDGVCNLCNSAIQYVIKHDKKDIFRFVALQSELGIEILEYIGINNKNIDSIILYEPRIAYYSKSNAILEIAKTLGGIFILFKIFGALPLGIRNELYDFVAKNRYKWFGNNESCLMPSSELVSKFL